MKRIQVIMGTFNHSIPSTTITGKLDRDYPYLEGIEIFFPDDTNVKNPILDKYRISDTPYLPDNFPALGIGVTNNHAIAPNDRFFSLLDKLFHDGKDFEAEISDASATVDYDICFLFKLSKEGTSTNKSVKTSENTEKSK